MLISARALRVRGVAGVMARIGDADSGELSHAMRGARARAGALALWCA